MGPKYIGVVGKEQRTVNPCDPWDMFLGGQVLDGEIQCACTPVSQSLEP